MAKSIAQRVASNFGWSVVSEAIGKGVFFITNIYLARTLGVENFGLFTLAQSITFYFWLAVDLGTNMYGIREIAKYKEHAENIINPLLTLRITSGLVVFFIYVISLFFFNMPMMNKLTFAGCGIYLLTYSFYTDWILKGFEKFKFISFGSLVSSTIFLSGTFYLVKDNEDVAIASFIWSLSYLFGSISLLYFLYRKLGIKYRPSFNLKIWFSHLKESIHFTISGSLMVLYQYFPILLLGTFLTNYEVGIFSAAYRAVLTVCNAAFLIPMAFYPVLSHLYYRNPEEFLKYHKIFRIIMIIIGMPIGLLGTIWGSKIVNFLFGAQYSHSIIIFKIIIWLVPLYLLRYSYGSVLLACGYHRNYFFASLCSTVFMFTVGVVLIYRFGYLGCVFALLTCEMFMIAILIRIYINTVLNSLKARVVKHAII